jgi:hypothetical protein
MATPLATSRRITKIRIDDEQRFPALSQYFGPHPWKTDVYIYRFLVALCDCVSGRPLG